MIGGCNVAEFVGCHAARPHLAYVVLHPRHLFGADFIHWQALAGCLPVGWVASRCLDNPV